MAKEKRLLNQLTEYCASDAYPFHMPGHKRTDAIPQMSPYFALDITEIEGFDELHHPEGILREIEKQAADLYQAKDAFLLVNGSTAGVLAAILSLTEHGGTLFLGRTAHKSAYHACYLQRLTPIYLPSPQLEYGVPGPLSPGEIAQAMDEHPDTKVVCLTSPTYEGLVLDIEGIAKEVHARNGLLIVDGAHGAHLGLAPCVAPHPIQLGADVVVVSLHKTMPAMTQTALLLVGSDRVDRKRLKRHLSMVQTTSPSYILMSSIQESILYAKAYGEEKLQQMAQSCEKLQALVGTRCQHVVVCQGKQTFGTKEAWDIGKLLITTKNGERTGLEIDEELRKNHHLQLEMATPHYALAMATMMDSPQAFERLGQALLQMDAQIAQRADKARKKQTTAQTKNTLPKVVVPRVAMPLWEAYQQPLEEISLEECIGRICGEFVGLYPPGVPLLVPGEVMDATICATILDYLNMGFSLQGVTKIGQGAYVTVLKQ